MKKGYYSAIVACVLTIGLVLSLSSGVQAKTEWKMALGDAAGGTQAALGEQFSKLMSAYTDGEVDIHLFYAGQLGSEQETVQNCRLGTLDYSIVAINNITPFSPTVGLFTLPYLILSLDDAVKLTQGPIGDELKQNTIRDAGVRLLGWAYSGFRVLSGLLGQIKKMPEGLTPEASGGPSRQ